MLSVSFGLFKSYLVVVIEFFERYHLICSTDEDTTLFSRAFGGFNIPSRERAYSQHIRLLLYKISLDTHEIDRKASCLVLQCVRLPVEIERRYGKRYLDLRATTQPRKDAHSVLLLSNGKVSHQLFLLVRKLDNFSRRCTWYGQLWPSSDWRQEKHRDPNRTKATPMLPMSKCSLPHRTGSYLRCVVSIPR